MGDHQAWIVVGPGTPGARTTPIASRLLIGRECRGADPSQRLILPDPTISREHLELRRAEQGGATLVDLSTNGTRLNGRRVERGEAIPVADGDLIEVGNAQLLFRDLGPSTGAHPVVREAELTMVVTPSAELAIVVGDIVGYTEATERDGAAAVAAAAEVLFGSLRDLLVAHRGTVSNYVGDAIFAAWELEHDADAVPEAIRFALAANELVASTAGSLDVRGNDGEPLRLGWAVTHGEAVMSRPSAGQAAALGDAVNLAFRLAGIAARDGRAPILAASETAALASSVADYGEPFELAIKGRNAPARVCAVRSAGGS